MDFDMVNFLYISIYFMNFYLISSNILNTYIKSFNFLGNLIFYKIFVSFSKNF